MLAHGPVAGAVAFVGGPAAKAVAPLLYHVEAFGMPDVSLQPHVLPLPPVEFQQQVAVAAPGLATLPLRQVLLLVARLLALLHLGKGDGGEDSPGVSWWSFMERQEHMRLKAVIPTGIVREDNRTRYRYVKGVKDNAKHPLTYTRKGI